jgi:hypothetical protein
LIDPDPSPWEEEGEDSIAEDSEET